MRHLGNRKQLFFSPTGIKNCEVGQTCTASTERTPFSQAFRTSSMAAGMLRQISCHFTCLSHKNLHSEHCFPHLRSSLLVTLKLATYTSFISEELFSRVTRLSTFPGSGLKQGWSGFNVLPSSGIHVCSHVSKKGVSPEGLGSDRIT